MELQAATATPSGLNLDAASGAGDTAAQARPEAKPAKPRDDGTRAAILSGPILTTLLKLALPTMVVLLAQTAVACVLVFRLSIPRYLVVSPIIGYSMMGALALWTFWYMKHMKQRGQAASGNVIN